MVYEIQVRVNIQKLFQWMEIDSHSVVQDVLLVKFLERSLHPFPDTPRLVSTLYAGNSAIPCIWSGKPVKLQQNLESG